MEVAVAMTSLVTACVRAPMNALQDVEAREAAPALLCPSGVERTPSGGASAEAASRSQGTLPGPSIVPPSPFLAAQVGAQQTPLFSCY